MSNTLFGTDGIRAPFGTYPLDEPTVKRLGFQLGRTLAGRPSASVVLGGDTRSSTPELSTWLSAGLWHGGVVARVAGVLPTPGIAFLARDTSAEAGIAISASHNPWPDNGIKLIAGDGFKWNQEDELALEESLGESVEIPDEAESWEPDPKLARRYIDALIQLFGEGGLDGLKMAVDTANGAASEWAPEFFASLGAEIELIGNEPNGENINLDCGSTHPETLQDSVTRLGTDLGVAFDGDADRALVVDGEGRLRDGDEMMFLWARWLHERDLLEPAAIVATSMSNLGLERALGRIGINVVRCDVGDRVVVETMRREGIRLGGEQSGHIVHLGLSTTGDGLLTAAQIATIVHTSGRPLVELLADYQRFPQVLKNMRVAAKPDFDTLPAVRDKARDIDERLGDEGRLVLRYSGTEPLARVMIEGPEQQLIDGLADELLEAIRAELGQGESPE